MKKILLVLIASLLIFITGCTNGMTIEGDRIVVEKRVGGENMYEHYRTIEDAGEVAKVKDILVNIKWGNSIASMAYPPHYKFYFESDGENGDSSSPVYQLWVSPNKENVELIYDGRYIQLDDRTSADLFRLITGMELSEVEVE